MKHPIFREGVENRKPTQAFSCLQVTAVTLYPVRNKHFSDVFKTPDKGLGL